MAWQILISFPFGCMNGRLPCGNRWQLCILATSPRSLEIFSGVYLLLCLPWITPWITQHEWCLFIGLWPTRPDDMAFTRVVVLNASLLCVVCAAISPASQRQPPLVVLHCKPTMAQCVSQGCSVCTGDPRALLVCDREMQKACRNACQVCHSFQSYARYTCYMCSDQPLHPLLSLVTADAAGLTGCSCAAASHIHTRVVARSGADALLSGALPVACQPACSTQSSVKCCVLFPAFECTLALSTVETSRCTSGSHAAYAGVYLLFSATPRVNLTRRVGMTLAQPGTGHVSC